VLGRSGPPDGTRGRIIFTDVSIQNISRPADGTDTVNHNILTLKPMGYTAAGLKCPHARLTASRRRARRPETRTPPACG